MTDSSLLETPLANQHRALHARMVPFAGYLMPIQYQGVVEEHRAVREKAGLFDVSHMGQVRLTGPDALASVQWLTTNNAEKLTPGKAQYSMFCNSSGGVIDDLVVYCIGPKEYLLCVNAATRANDLEWMKTQIRDRHFSVTLTDESDQFALLALQGPQSVAILSLLTSAPLSSLSPFTFCENTVAGKSALISRTGYTGEDGFELYVAPEHATHLWTELLNAGDRAGLRPIGLGARDTLRLEMKYPLYGHDLDEEHTPLEAGLGWVVKLDKTGFIGRDALAAQKQNGLRRRWVGFKLLERGVPRHGYEVHRNGSAIGIVTSGTHSPTLDLGIGCAYVDAAAAEVGTDLTILIRQKPFKAQVVKTPFVKPNSRGAANTL